MPSLNANGIRIAFDTTGDPKAVPLLLISGLGLQMTAWPDEFVEGLVELGFYVIRFDNRDSGLSTKFEHAGTPSLTLAWLKSLLHLPLKPPYRLEDMADDAIGVLRQQRPVGLARLRANGHELQGIRLDSGDTEVSFYEDGGIELEEVLRDHILLTLPMQKLCREDCKGICPRCGLNRNAALCSCDAKPVDDRWQALREVKLNLEKQ